MSSVNYHRKSLIDSKIPGVGKLRRAREPGACTCDIRRSRGEMDKQIARGRNLVSTKAIPITRKALVQRFSRILRYDDDGRYYLVTRSSAGDSRSTMADLSCHTVESRGAGRTAKAGIQPPNLQNSFTAGKRAFRIRVEVTFLTRRALTFMLRVRTQSGALINERVYRCWVGCGLNAKAQRQRCACRRVEPGKFLSDRLVILLKAGYCPEAGQFSRCRLRHPPRPAPSQAKNYFFLPPHIEI